MAFQRGTGFEKKGKEFPCGFWGGGVDSCTGKLLPKAKVSPKPCVPLNCFQEIFGLVSPVGTLEIPVLSVLFKHRLQRH